MSRRIRNPKAFDHAAKKRQHEYDELVAKVAQRIPNVITKHFEGNLSVPDVGLALIQLTEMGALTPNEGRRMPQAHSPKLVNRRQGVVSDALRLAIADGAIIEKIQGNTHSFTIPDSAADSANPGRDVEDYMRLIRSTVPAKVEAEYI